MVSKVSFSLDTKTDLRASICRAGELRTSPGSHSFHAGATAPHSRVLSSGDHSLPACSEFFPPLGLVLPSERQRVSLFSPAMATQAQMDELLWSVCGWGPGRRHLFPM